jgi:hypothetical protein
VAEHLASKCGTLSSNSSTTKKTKKETKTERERKRKEGRVEGRGMEGAKKIGRKRKHY